MQNQNSGGWRYGNGGSNQFLYRNEEVDNDLLRRAAEVAAPKGLLDTKIEAAPIDKFLQQGNDSGSGGDYGGPSGTPGNVSNTMGVETQFGWGGPSLSGAKAGAAFGPVGAALGGLLGGITSNSYSNQKTVDAFDMSNFGITGSQIDAARANSKAMTSMQDAFNADREAEAAMGSFIDSIGTGIGVGGDGGGWSPSYGDSGTADSPGGSDMGGYGGADNGYYKGGMVTPNRLAGPNPRGPDDGYAALDVGEMVIKKSAVKKHRGLLDAINSDKG